MSRLPSILIASNNAHKLQEFREIFTQSGAMDTALLTPQALSLDIEPEETGETYLENARIKARAFERLIRDRNDLPTLWIMADDSGLEVDALGGGPGVRSARYHRTAPNKDGCEALLTAMIAVPENRRTGRFRSVIVILTPDRHEHVFEGACEGSIGFDKRGTEGFGFDPVFRIAGDSRHLAEMSSEEKHRVSHRGKAAQAVIAFLKAIRA